MAANPKPLRKEHKAMSSEMREHGKKTHPHKGTRKAVIEAKVKVAKARPMGERLAKFEKREGAGDYGQMRKEQRAKAAKHMKMHGG
jgi:hypothetical protein